MATKVVMVLAVIAIYLNTSAAIEYLFTSGEYTLEETGVANVDVIIQRSSTDESDTDVSSTVNLNTDCPKECPIMPGIDLAVDDTSANGGDYTIDRKSITFEPTVLQKTISITIHNDADEEQREYFCLSVIDPDVRGSQWTTKIIIPWNDHCVKHVSLPTDAVVSSGTAENIAYFIENPITSAYGYIGPWDTDETITLKVTPQPDAHSGDNNDISIFLTNVANTLDSSLDYYGIHLDDSEAANDVHIAPGGTATAPASFITKGTTGNIAAPNLGTVLGSATDSSDAIDDLENTFELSYDDSSGLITLDRTTSGSSAFQLQQTDGTPLTTIDNLFVSSAQNKYALWEICGLEPKRLPMVAASASGYAGPSGPESVIDGILDSGANPLSCFVSLKDEATNNHWLQVDLGREFKVETIIIVPIPSFDYQGYADPETLNDAQVYVGSCREEDVANNVLCKNSIGTVANGANPVPDDVNPLIEIVCDDDDVYGRYVYILPDTSTNPIALCDVFVYGDEVPINEEPKVEFSLATNTANEDDASVTLSVTRSLKDQTGCDTCTCTYVDYYTDTSTDDFTEVPPSAPKSFKWIGKDAVSPQEIDISINDDDVCESDESFNVYLTNIEGGILGTKCWTTVEIEDEDAVTYSIVSTSTSINEGDGPLRLQVDRTGAGNMQEGRATLTFSDIEATSKDYDNAPQMLSSFSTSSNTQVGSVTIHDDECFEESETFRVSLDHLEPEDCSGAGASSPLTISITDNDSQFEWDISTENVLCVSEDSGVTTVNIVREGTSLHKTVEFDIDYGTAEDNDFSIVPASSSISFAQGRSSEPVTITIPDDYDVEGDESFTLTLRDPYGEGCPNGNRGDDYRLHIKIEDNDAEYNWENANYEFDENDGQIEVCLVRTGDTSTTKGVQLSTLTGTSALSGSDFSPLTLITFTRGDARKCGRIQLTGDNEVEGYELFRLMISEGQNIAIGSQHTAIIGINDDDSVVGWEQPSYSVIEGARIASAYISKTGNNAVTVSVSSSPSTALSGTDFKPISRSYLIPATDDSYPVQVEIIDDTDDESPETFVLTLTASSTGTISQPTTTIAITDDDPAPTEPPPPEGLSAGAIAGITVAAVVGGLTGFIGIFVGVYFYSRRAGAPGTAAAAGTRPVAFAPGPGGSQLVNLGYPSGNAYGLSNNGFGNQFGVNDFKPYGLGGFA